MTTLEQILIKDIKADLKDLKELIFNIDRRLSKLENRFK